MLLHPDCIPCILQMTISCINRLGLDETSIKELYAEILEIPSLRGLFWDTTSAEVIEDVWRKIVKKIGTPDPFSSEKADQNKKITELYPFLEEMLDKSEDPLCLAVKLAILGNSLDFMVADTSLAIENTISDRVKVPLPGDSYIQFQQQITVSKHITYFGDNAGEIVFDKLLIETIKKMHSPEIVYVVRGGPVINDATLEDARFAGHDRLATLTTNGAAFPGFDPASAPGETRRAYEKADIVISKGQGNLEMLLDARRRVFFLLRVRCEEITREIGIPQGAGVCLLREP